MDHIDQRGFAPRTIAAARTQRAIASRLTLRKGVRRLKWWFRRYVERLALAWRYRRDMDSQLQADDHMLKDIGLTHGHSSQPTEVLAMRKAAILLYGLLSYAFFLVTFIYAIGFVGGYFVPKGIDDGPTGPIVQTVLVDLALLLLFAIQHSVMARPWFKRWCLGWIDPALERPTYVLLATAALAVLMWQWRPLPQLIWSMTDPTLSAALTALSLSGWLLVLLSTFMISHFELFGLKQVFMRVSGRGMPAAEFRTPGLYKLVRHPIYLGFIIAFWATPVMSQGHLLFAAVTTGYILIGIMLEEHDLIALFGDDYRRYRERVFMLLPFSRKGAVRRSSLAPAPTHDARHKWPR